MSVCQKTFKNHVWPSTRSKSLPNAAVTTHDIDTWPALCRPRPTLDAQTSLFRCSDVIKRRRAVTGKRRPIIGALARLQWLAVADASPGGRVGQPVSYPGSSHCSVQHVITGLLTVDRTFLSIVEPVREDLVAADVDFPTGRLSVWYCVIRSDIRPLSGRHPALAAALFSCGPVDEELNATSTSVPDVRARSVTRVLLELSVLL